MEARQLISILTLNRAFRIKDTGRRERRKRQLLVNRLSAATSNEWNFRKPSWESRNLEIIRTFSARTQRLVRAGAFYPNKWIPSKMSPKRKSLIQRCVLAYLERLVPCIVGFKSWLADFLRFLFSELLGVAYTQIRNPDSNLSLLGRS